MLLPAQNKMCHCKLLLCIASTTLSVSIYLVMITSYQKTRVDEVSPFIFTTSRCYINNGKKWPNPQQLVPCLNTAQNISTCNLTLYQSLPLIFVPHQDKTGNYQSLSLLPVFFMAPKIQPPKYIPDQLKEVVIPYLKSDRPVEEFSPTL